MELVSCEQGSQRTVQQVIACGDWVQWSVLWQNTWVGWVPQWTGWSGRVSLKRCLSTRTWTMRRSWPGEGRPAERSQGRDLSGMSLGQWLASRVTTRFASWFNDIETTELWAHCLTVSRPCFSFKEWWKQNPFCRTEKLLVMHLTQCWNILDAQ